MSQSDLPRQSLQFDSETLKVLEKSRIKKSIVTLIMLMRSKKAAKIALLSWNLEDETRSIAELITMSLSQNLEQKCALVITEGLKHRIDVLPTHAIITLPEVDAPINPDDAAEFHQQTQNFPIQIFSGPALERNEVLGSHPFQVAKQSEAQVMLVSDEDGLSKTAAEAIAKITKDQNFNWLCVLPVARELKSAENSQ